MVLSKWYTMTSPTLPAYLSAIFCVALAFAAPHNDRIDPVFSGLNERPIIGILSMELEMSSLTNFGDYSSHIGASYVKFLEGSGARVVPIMIYKKPSYYKEIVQKVNGILLPGTLSLTDGNSEEEMLRGALLPGAGYSVAGYLLYKYALEQNLQGNYLPVWGICMGFEVLSIFATGPSMRGVGIRERCSSNNQMLPLEFTEEAKDSRLFGNAPESILKILSEESVTPHFHQYCVTEEAMTKHDLTSSWRILSTNHDFDGMKFVSTIEAKNIPFYGSIYHPEKIAFEWVETEDTPHNSNAVKVMQYYSNFLVDEARKNSNRYPSEEEEEKALIYNYNVTYTGKSSHYEQVYFFN